MSKNTKRLSLKWQTLLLSLLFLTLTLGSILALTWYQHYQSTNKLQVTAVKAATDIEFLLIKKKAEFITITSTPRYQAFVNE